MWYWYLYATLAVVFVSDAVSRGLRGQSLGWGIGILLLGPVVLPIYLAKRPIKEGEVREGGAGWNGLKHFALQWTLLTVIYAVSVIFDAAEQTRGVSAEVERAAVYRGEAEKMMVIAALWFFTILGALCLGLFLKTSLVERGQAGAGSAL